MLGGDGEEEYAEVVSSTKHHRQDESLRVTDRPRRQGTMNTTDEEEEEVKSARGQNQEDVIADRASHVRIDDNADVDANADAEEVRRIALNKAKADSKKLTTKLKAVQLRKEAATAAILRAEELSETTSAGEIIEEAKDTIKTAEEEELALNIEFGELLIRFPVLKRCAHSAKAKWKALSHAYDRYVTILRNHEEVPLRLTAPRDVFSALANYYFFKSVLVKQSLQADTWFDGPDQREIGANHSMSVNNLCSYMDEFETLVSQGKVSETEAWDIVLPTFQQSAPANSRLADAPTTLAWIYRYVRDCRTAGRRCTIVEVAEMLRSKGLLMFDPLDGRDKDNAVSCLRRYLERYGFERGNPDNLEGLLFDEASRAARKAYYTAMARVREKGLRRVYVAAAFAHVLDQVRDGVVDDLFFSTKEGARACLLAAIGDLCSVGQEGTDAFKRVPLGIVPNSYKRFDAAKMESTNSRASIAADANSVSTSEFLSPDNHVHLDSDQYLTWFERTLLPNLSAPSAIIVDDVTLHKVIEQDAWFQANMRAIAMRKRKTAPAASAAAAETKENGAAAQEEISVKNEIYAFCKRHDIPVPYGEDTPKQDAKDIARLEDVDAYMINAAKNMLKLKMEKAAYASNHEVVCYIPADHSDLQPMHEVWESVRRKVARSNALTNSTEPGNFYQLLQEEFKRPDGPTHSGTLEVHVARADRAARAYERFDANNSTATQYFHDVIGSKMIDMLMADGVAASMIRDALAIVDDPIVISKFTFEPISAGEAPMAENDA